MFRLSLFIWFDIENGLSFFYSVLIFFFLLRWLMKILSLILLSVSIIVCLVLIGDFLFGFVRNILSKNLIVILFVWVINFFL